MERLARLLDASDPDLAAHGMRTARLAGDIALRMGFDRDRIRLLEVAARLHDIGKLFVPRQILDHPGPLTEAQWVELRHHPRMGYELVKDHVPQEVAEIVVTHHERFDGAGYPGALAGHAVSVESRILQVADAFDAITSERPYQPALPVDYAVAEMIRCSGSQFDPAAVEAVVGLAGGRKWRATRFGQPSSYAGEVAV